MQKWILLSHVATLAIIVVMAFHSAFPSSGPEKSFFGSRESVITYYLIEERFWRLERIFDDDIYIYRKHSFRHGPGFTIAKPSGWSEEDKNVLYGLANSAKILFSGTSMEGLVRVSVVYSITDGRGYRELSKYNFNQDGADVPNLALVQFILGESPYDGSPFNDDPFIPLKRSGLENADIDAD